VNTKFKILKTITTFIFSLIIISGAFSQEKKEQKSKMLDFVSKTGVIIKFEDYNLPKLKLNYGVAEAKIRKIISGNEKQFFLQISKKGQYNTKTASIAYEDILEIQKALTSLQDQSVNDLVTLSDYLENKFITDDGFQIGYLINKGKITWYVTLEKYGSGNTAFAKDLESLVETFKFGKEKIEGLK